MPCCFPALESKRASIRRAAGSSGPLALPDPIERQHRRVRGPGCHPIGGKLQKYIVTPGGGQGLFTKFGILSFNASLVKRAFTRLGPPEKKSSNTLCWASRIPDESSWEG